MSFSPRPRPHTVNLSFTDPDLTDNYQDITATHSQQSTTGRHPRGDTPLSRRSQGGGGTPSSSTSTSQTRYASLSNLDKLLDYLDDEDNNTLSTRRESSTPVSYHRTANLPPSTARRLDQSQDSPDSPSPRPGSVAAMRSGDRSFIQAQGGLSFREPSTTQRLQDELEADHRATAEEEERRQQEERDPDGASVDSITRVAQAALDEFDTIISLGSSTAHTQLSPRVSNSFTSARKDRPPSRFRNIPSPPPSEQQRPPTSAYEPLPYSSSTSFTRTQEYGGREPVEEEEERDEREFIREESVRPSTHSTTELAGYDPHELNLQLINELREAQDYIQFLQSELRTIGQVVTKLRDHEERAEEEGAIGESNGTGERGGGRDGAERLVSTMKAGQGRKNEEVTRGEPLSGSSVANLLGNSNRDCFEIVKHLIAMIPTTQNSQSLSIESISSSMEFVRKMDTLVIDVANGAGGGDRRGGDGFGRRDENVFEKGNLERLEKEIEARVLGSGRDMDR